MRRWIAVLIMAGALAGSCATGWSAGWAQTGGGSRTGLSWETPPVDYLPAQKKGWLAGIAAARADYRAHKKFDLNGHGDYVHPGISVPMDDFRDYRFGYKKGYEAAIKHVTSLPF